MPDSGPKHNADRKREESPGRAPHDLEIPEILRAPVSPRRETAGGAGGSEAGMWGMAKAWGIAFDFIFTIIAGAALGWGFDKWRGSEPKGLMTGLILGFVVAFVRIVRATLKQEREEQARKNKR